MVNRPYWKNILRTARGSMSRFLAIFAIVALGSGFLAGVLASPLDMRISADSYMDQSDMYDLRVVSTQGLTDGDIEELRKLEGVLSAGPAYDTDTVLISETGDSHTARIHTLPSSGRYHPELLEGRYPESAGECAVILTKTFTGDSDWLGKKLSVDPGEENENMVREFTVVGTVRSALYISLENERTQAGTGSIDLKLYTPPESFDQDYYTAAYITVDGSTELNSFTGEYDALIDDMSARLEELGEERAVVRYNEIIDEANAELSDAQKEYDDAKADADRELSDALKELEDAEKELDHGRQELEEAKKELEDGQKEIDGGWAEYRAEIANAQKEIDNGWAQIDGYQAQLDSGFTEISAAQKQITAGYKELESSEGQLAAAKAQLDATKVQLNGLAEGKAALAGLAAQLGLPQGDGSDAWAIETIIMLEQVSPEAGAQFAQLKTGLESLAAQGTDSAAANAALEKGLAEYEQGKKQAQDARTRLDQNQRKLNTQLSELRNQQAELDAQKGKLYSAENTLNTTKTDTEKKLQDAQQELEEGRLEYEDGLTELEDGEKELKEGWEDYYQGKREAEEELADAEQKLLDARADIDGLEQGEWYVFTRDDNAGFSSYASNADKIAAIATVFPVFFFLVAALVALTTMTRMVEEERGQIGAMKALGYSPVRIAGKYLLYAAAASLFGCVFGITGGMWLFPTVIINAYNIMYDLPKVLTPFSWPLAIFSAVTATLCTLAATLSACWNALRESPACLMLPKAPKAGKRILLERVTPLWSRLKFTQKVTARNLIRYKKRFFMTVLGIAGCTALLVTGFGIRDSISDIVGIQYGELCNYNLIVGLKSEEALTDPELMEILEDESRVADSLAVLQDAGSVVPNGGGPADDITIFVPSDTERLPDFFHFRHRGDNRHVEYGENSVIVTEKLSERQHLKVGDTITVRNQDETEASFTVTDICENYVQHLLYISPAAYEEGFGAKPEMNSLLCLLPEEGPKGGADALTTRLLECDEVALATSTEELSRSFNNSISSINYIVVVLIISAGALAFVVVYNLTNINITERVKELATIKVLGFYESEVAAYVYRETAALTVIGTAVGLLLGVVLHQFVIRTAEIDMVMFGRSIYAPSYIFSAVLTVLFSVLVNLVMYRKLAKISMVESMKAPE